MDSKIIHMAARLNKWAVNSDLHTLRGLDRVGKIALREIQTAIGTYRYSWPPLSAKTIARKRTGDSPLLETGALRDSYGATMVDRETIEVGSDDPKAQWHEFGTSRMPPRPVLGEMVKAKEADIVKVLGEGALGALELKP